MSITTSSSEARDLFHKGREAWTNTDRIYADSIFEIVIKHDPGFALAYIYKNTPAEIHKAKQLIPDVTIGEANFIRATEALYLNGEIELSELIVDSLLTIHPHAKYCLHLAARLYYDRKPKLTIDYLDKALKEDRYFGAAYHLKAYQLLHLKRFDEAETVLKKYHYYFTDLPNAQDSYAELFMLKGEDSLAVKHYNLVNHLDPSWKFVFVRIAWLYIRQGNFDVARQYATRLLEIAINSHQKFWAIWTLSSISYIEGDLPDALKRIDNYLSVVEDSSYPTAEVEVLHHKGWYALQVDSIELAIDYFDQALEKLYNTEAAIDNRSFNLMVVHGGLWKAYMKLGRKSDTDLHLKKVRLFYSQSLKTQNTIRFYRAIEAEVALQRGDIMLAKSNAFLPGHQASSSCQYYLGKALEMDGKIQEALVEYEKGYYQISASSAFYFNKLKTKMRELSEF